MAATGFLWEPLWIAISCYLIISRFYVISNDVKNPFVFAVLVAASWLPIAWLLVGFSSDPNPLNGIAIHEHVSVPMQYVMGFVSYGILTLAGGIILKKAFDAGLKPWPAALGVAGIAVFMFYATALVDAQIAICTTCPWNR